MDKNNNGIEDSLENLRFFIKIVTPLIVLVTGVCMSIFGATRDYQDLKDLGVSLLLGGSLASGTVQERKK